MIHADYSNGNYVQVKVYVGSSLEKLEEEYKPKYNNDRKLIIERLERRDYKPSLTYFDDYGDTYEGDFVIVPFKHHEYIGQVTHVYDTPEEAAQALGQPLDSINIRVVTGFLDEL